LSRIQDEKEFRWGNNLYNENDKKNREYSMRKTRVKYDKMRTGNVKEEECGKDKTGVGCDGCG
jgi:hypothetical protein